MLNFWPISKRVSDRDIFKTNNKDSLDGEGWFFFVGMELHIDSTQTLHLIFESCYRSRLIKSWQAFTVLIPTNQTSKWIWMTRWLQFEFIKHSSFTGQGFWDNFCGFYKYLCFFSGKFNVQNKMLRYHLRSPHIAPLRCLELKTLRRPSVPLSVPPACVCPTLLLNFMEVYLNL